MIEQIKIENFKCFPELTLPLAEMTVLAGANASGKSSIIQALLLADGTMHNNGKMIDVSSVMKIAIGDPRTLISQEPKDMEKGDFYIALKERGQYRELFYYIDKLSPLKLLADRAGDDLVSRVFYLNAERCGPRLSYPAKSDDEILKDGSNAAYLIDRADLEGRRVPALLALSSPESKFSVQVEQWMDAVLGDINLFVSTDLGRAVADVKYANAMAKQGVLPSMTGFGISYILSIITAGLWCASIENAVLIVENPEAHLHPGAQSNMGKFLELVSESGVQVIIETHSEHVIDGVRLQAAWGKSTDRVEICFFSSCEGKIQEKQISLSESGELSEWPEGFFDQKSLDLRKLFEIRRQNARK